MPSSGEKPFKMTVVFQDTKGPLDLYRAIKSKLYPLRCCDVPPGLLAQIDQIAFDGEQLIRILFRLKTLILVLAAAAITA